MSCGECYVISLYFVRCSVGISVCLAGGLRFCELFGKTIRNVVVILLLNVMELLSVVGGALLDRPYMVFHKMCVVCMWSQ